MENKSSEDREIEEFTTEMNKIRDLLEPYQKPILYISFTLFLLIVGFVGFAFGANNICVQVEGFLTDKFECHLDYYPNGTLKVPSSIINTSRFEGWQSV